MGKTHRGLLQAGPALPVTVQEQSACSLVPGAYSVLSPLLCRPHNRPGQRGGLGGPLDRWERWAKS